MNHPHPLSRSSTPSPSFSSGSSSYHALPTPSPTAIGYQQHQHRAYPTIMHTMAPPHEHEHGHEHGHGDTLCNNQPEHDVDFDRRTFLQMDFGTGSDIDLDINFDSDEGQLDLGLNLRTLSTTLSSTKPLQRLYSPSEITFDVDWTPLRAGVNVGVYGDKEEKEDEEGGQSRQGQTRSRGNNGRTQVDMDIEVGPYGHEHERGRRSGTTSAESVCMSQVQTQAPATVTATAMSVNTSTAAVEDWDIDGGCDDFYRREPEPAEGDRTVGLLSTMRPHPFKTSAFVGSSSSSVENWQQCRHQRQRQDSSASHPHSHSHSHSTHIKTTHMRTMLEELLPGARGSLALQFEALSSRVALLGLDGVDEGVGVSEGVERLLLEDPRAAWAELCFEEAAPEEDEEQVDASSVSRVSASPVLIPSVGVAIVSNSNADRAASVSKWPHTLTTQAQMSNSRPLPPLPPLPQQLPPLPTQAHPSHIHEGLYAVDGIRTWESSPLLPYSTRPPSLAMPPPYSARDGDGDGDGDDEIVGFGSVFGYEGSLCLGAEGEEIRRSVFGIEDQANARRESIQTQSQSQASTPRTPTINLQGTIAESNDHTFGHALSSDARRQSVPISYAESFLSEESSTTTTASQSAPSLASGSSLAPSPSPSSSCGSLSYTLSLTNEMKGSMPPEADIVNTLTIVGAWGEMRSQTDSYPHTHAHTRAHTRSRSHSRNRTSSTPKLSSKTVLDRAEAIARIYGPTPIDPSDPNTNSNNWHSRSYPHKLRECDDDSSLVGRERAKARLRAFLDAGDGGVNGADSGVPPGLDLEFERAWSGEGGGGDVVPGLGLTSDSDPGHDGYVYAYGRHSQHHANETKYDDDHSRQRLPASRTRSLPGPYLLSLPRGINSHLKSGENECEGEGDGGDGDDRDEYKHKDPHLQIRVSAFVTSPSSPPPTHLRHYHQHQHLLSDSNADTHSRACAQTAHHVHNPYHHPYPHAYTHTHAITGSPPSSRIPIAPPKSSHLVVLPPVVKPDEGIGYAPVRKEKGSGTTLLRIANGLGMRWR